MTTHELLLAAKAAAPALAWLGSEEKNAAILRMADAIVRETDVILAANEADVQAAKGTISDVMLDRLRLTQARIAAMADGMRQVSALPDPVGEVLAEVRRPNGLVIRKTAVPLGVVAIIYESRPNVTSDAAVLAMKSGNVCVLRGGKEAYRSAAAIVAAMHEGLREAGLPETFVNLVSDPTRRSAQELMTPEGGLLTVQIVITQPDGTMSLLPVTPVTNTMGNTVYWVDESMLSDDEIASLSTAQLQLVSDTGELYAEMPLL